MGPQAYLCMHPYHTSIEVVCLNFFWKRYLIWTHEWYLVTAYIVSETNMETTPMRRPGVCVHLPRKLRAVLRVGLPGPMYSKVTYHTGARTPSREGTKVEILFSSQDAFPSRLIKCKNFIGCKRDSL